MVFYLFIYFYKFIYLFLAALGLRCCVRAFSSCGERGLLFVAVRRLLIAVASLVVEHGLQGTRGFSSCVLRGMWDLPRPGLEPVSPALAGGFLTTAPPGKPYLFIYLFIYLFRLHCVACGIPAPRTRDRTRTLSHESPNHCTARQLPIYDFFKNI